MAIDITMPALSPTMESGTIAKWHVREGDRVKPGDVVADIETDKASMEIEAVDEGTVLRLLTAEGSDEVIVGTVIAILAEDGDAVEVVGEDQEYVRPESAGFEQAILAARALESRSANLPDMTPSVKRFKTSPLARRLADENDVELSMAQGSGPNGRIVRADIERITSSREVLSVASVVKERGDSESQGPGPTAVSEAPDGVPMTAMKLTNMRSTLARRLVDSKQNVPHIYLSLDVRLDALLKLRGDLNAALAKGRKLTVNDFVIKALALALMEVPDANVQFAEDAIYQFERADISVAVSVPGGLMAPVVRQAERKSLSQISNEMKDFTTRARDGKLQLQDYAGGTASISNLGMFGIKSFDAIINPPQAMILAVGAAEERPCAVGEAIEVATILSVTGSFDHRGIDGAVGAELMAAFKRLVEAPLTMVV